LSLLRLPITPPGQLSWSTICCDFYETVSVLLVVFIRLKPAEEDESQLLFEVDLIDHLFKGLFDFGLFQSSPR
jgi:hypothetical protein